MGQNSLPAAIVDELLDALATDDSFRELFARNPEAAFERLGYPPTPEQLVCCKPGKLADKAVIADARDEMREKLILGELAYIPNKLDANHGKKKKR